MKVQKSLFAGIGILLFAAIFFVGAASAYVISFDAPSEIESGNLFVMTGTSTLPSGFTSEVVIYHKAQVGANKVGSFPFTIQDDKNWTVNVDTAGWEAGMYTLEIPTNSEYSYGGSSKLAHTFQITGSSAPVVTSVDAVTTATPSVESTTTATTLPVATQKQSPVSIVSIFAALGLCGAIACMRRL